MKLDYDNCEVKQHYAPQRPALCFRQRKITLPGRKHAGALLQVSAASYDFPRAQELHGKQSDALL